MEDDVKAQVDEALRYVIEHLDVIVNAHRALGVPVSDLICHAIRLRLQPCSSPIVIHGDEQRRE